MLTIVGALFAFVFLMAILRTLFAFLGLVFRR
jgi:hypothetical protein